MRHFTFFTHPCLVLIVLSINNCNGCTFHASCDLNSASQNLLAGYQFGSFLRSRWTSVLFWKEETNWKCSKGALDASGEKSCEKFCHTKSLGCCKIFHILINFIKKNSIFCCHGLPWLVLWKMSPLADLPSPRYKKAYCGWHLYLKVFHTAPPMCMEGVRSEFSSCLEECVKITPSLYSW